MLLIGAILCAIAVILWIRIERDLRAHRDWCAHAAKADGVVARIGQREWLSRNKPASDDRVLAVPVVRFRAKNGGEYEFDAPDAPGEVGAAVEVAYDPEVPSTARTVVMLRRGGCVAVMFVAGVVLVGWGAMQ